MNFPKDGIRLHIANFDAICQQLKPMLESGDCYRLVIKPWRETRSLSQNALFHLWMGEISQYLIKRGKAFATPEGVKDALKHTSLGYEPTERVDVGTGEVTSVQSLRHTSKLETGEMHIFLCKVEAWAMHIGCHLPIPDSSEFQSLRDKQEA